MRLSCILLAALGHILSCSTGSADPPELFGFIFEDSTWTAAPPGPVYRIIGDVFVMEGATLTIEPGVTVEFAPHTDLLNSGDYFELSEILVSGSLQALGAPSDSIIFTSADSSLDSWGHVRLLPDAAAAIDYCIFSFADGGLRSDIPIALSDCRFHYCCFDCYYGASASLADCLIQDGGDFTVGGSLSIVSTVFESYGLRPAAGTVSGDSCLVRDTEVVFLAGADPTTFLTANAQYNHIESCALAAGLHFSDGASCIVTDTSIDGGTSLYSATTTTAFTSLELRESTQGISVSSDTALVSDCALHGCGMQLQGGKSVLVEHCLLAGSGNNGLACTSSIGTRIQNVTINDCSPGVTFAEIPTPKSVSLRNSIVSNCSDGIIGYGETAGVDIDYCDVWNSASIEGVEPDSAVYHVNPLYVDGENGDFHLQEISPLCTLGENGTQMGYYGPDPCHGPAATWNSPVNATPPRLSVVPNPCRVQAKFIVEDPLGDSGTIELFSLQGRRIWKSAVPLHSRGLTTIAMDQKLLYGLPTGIYWIRLESRSGSVGRRLVKLR
ncbi:MAG: T9SS type A sorting domain-containing protein [Candidatus Eisenbacteria bacterium]|nr:T9SS type A sorting domain-containing protein [Candidatus Eisenbacteria bacterium]